MKKSAFSISEGIRQKQLLGTQLLGGSEGRGFWTIKGKPVNVEIILRPEDSLNTLYPEIRKDALDYFRRYNISWWRQNEDIFPPDICCHHRITVLIICLPSAIIKKLFLL